MHTNHHESSLWDHRWIAVCTEQPCTVCLLWKCFVTIVQLANSKWKLIISPTLIWCHLIQSSSCVVVISTADGFEVCKLMTCYRCCLSWYVSHKKKSWVISSPQVINTPTPYSSACTQNTHTSSFSRKRLQFPVRGGRRLKRGKRQVLARRSMGGKMGVSESIFVWKSLWALMCWRAEIIIWEMRKGMGLVKNWKSKPRPDLTPLQYVSYRTAWRFSISKAPC